MSRQPQPFDETPDPLDALLAEAHWPEPSPAAVDRLREQWKSVLAHSRETGEEPSDSPNRGDRCLVAVLAAMELGNASSDFPLSSHSHFHCHSRWNGPVVVRGRYESCIRGLRAIDHRGQSATFKSTFETEGKPPITTNVMFLAPNRFRDECPSEFRSTARESCSFSTRWRNGQP